MNFQFSDAHNAFRAKIRSFCRTQITPEVLARAERSGCQHDDAFYKKLAEHGFLGMQWPTEYGGQGLDQIYMAIFSEEMSYAGAPFGRYNASTVFVGQSIVIYGGDEQKAYWLPRIARGEVSCSWCLTEPDAGSDAAALQLRAQAAGSGYKLNGTKIMISGAGVSDLGMVATRTTAGGRKYEGITLFLVPLRSPGLMIRPIETLGDGYVYELIFDDVFVPEANLLGEKDSGWQHILTTLSFERSVIGRVGRLMRQYDELLRAVAERGVTLDSGRRDYLQDLKLRIRAARWINYKVAWMQTQGVVPHAEASTAKLVTSELGVEVSQACLDLLGFDAVCLNEPFERAYRAQLAHLHAGATAEIQRTVLATVGLGLPRS